MTSEKQKQEAIDRILSPSTGRTKTSYGLFLQQDSVQEVLEVLASALQAEPDLIYGLHRYSCTLILRDIVFLRDVYSKLPNLLTPPEESIPGSPRYDNLRQILQQITPSTPSTSPLFQQLWRAIEEVKAPPSILGQSYEKKREEAMTLVLALQTAEEALVQNVNYLVNILTVFEGLNLTPILARRPLTRGLSWVKTVEQQGSSDGGLRVLALRASLQAIQKKRSLGKFYEASGFLEPGYDDKHPRAPARLKSLFGPFVLPNSLTGTLYSHTQAEPILILASKRAELQGSLQEKYRWVDNLVTIYDSFSFGGDHFLEFYIRKEDGMTVDGSLLLREGNYTGAEFAAVFNSHWQTLGLGGIVLASAFPFLEFNTAPGHHFAIAPSPGATILGLTIEEGFRIGVGEVSLTQPTSSGPFSLSSSNNTLLLSVSTPTRPATTVEVTLPTGGSVSAASVQAAINERLAQLGLSGWFEAYEILGQVRLGISIEQAGYVLAIVGGTALIPLGWSPESVESIYNNTNIQFFYKLPSGGEVGVNGTIPVGYYSAKTLAEALETALGGNFSANAVGVPGYRTVAISYRGPEAAQAKMRADSNLVNGLSRYLNFPTGFYFTGSHTTVQDLLGFIQNRVRGVKSSLEMDTPDSLIGITFSGQINRIRLYRYKISAFAEGNGSTTLRLTKDTPWVEASVGEGVVVTSGSLTNSGWVVIGKENNDKTLLVEGQVYTGQELVVCIVGPNQSGRIGYFLQTEDPPLFGTYEVQRVLDPLTVEVGGILTPSEVEANFLEGRMRIVLESPEPFSISPSSPQQAPAWQQIFPSLEAHPTYVWAKIPEEVEMQVGDLFWSFEANQSQPAIQRSVLEVDGRWILLDEDLGTSGSIPLHASPKPFVRGVLVDARYLRLQNAIAYLSAWLLGVPERKKKWSEVRAQAYRSLSTPRPHPYVVASLVQAVRTALLDLEDFSSFLETYQQDPTLSLTRLFRFLEERGADRTLQALQRCNLEQAFRSDAFDAFQYAFDQLRAVAETYLSRSMEEEEIIPEGFEYNDTEEDLLQDEEDDFLRYK